ncbi:MAG: hypothetical protein VW371_00440 [Bacteroidota bacterium]
MNAYKANLINSFSLIIFGVWGYIDSSSITALIPVMIGGPLLVCSSGIEKGNKIISHLAVLATLVILVALIGMRLPKSLDQGGIGLYRVIAMIATSSIAMIFFIKSFIQNRKSK